MHSRSRRGLWNVCQWEARWASLVLSRGRGAGPPNPSERANEIGGGAKLCQPARGVLSRPVTGAGRRRSWPLRSPQRPSNAGRGRTRALPIGARRRPIQTDSGLERPRAEERAKSDVCCGRDHPPRNADRARKATSASPRRQPPALWSSRSGKTWGIGGSHEEKLRGGRRRRSDARARRLRAGGYARKEVKPGSRELAERRRVAGGLRDTQARLWEKLRGFLNAEERRKISTEETWVGNLSPVSKRERNPSAPS